MARNCSIASCASSLALTSVPSAAFSAADWAILPYFLTRLTIVETASRCGVSRAHPTKTYVALVLLRRDDRLLDILDRLVRRIVGRLLVDVLLDALLRLARAAAGVLGAGRRAVGDVLGLGAGLVARRQRRQLGALLALLLGRPRVLGGRTGLVRGRRGAVGGLLSSIGRDLGSVGGEVAQDHGRVAEDAAEGVGRQDELADLLDRRDGLAHVGLDLVAGDADELARVGRIDVDVGVRRRVEELLELVVAWAVSRCVRQRRRTVLLGTDA